MAFSKSSTRSGKSLVEFAKDFNPGDPSQGLRILDMLSEPITVNRAQPSQIVDGSQGDSDLDRSSNIIGKYLLNGWTMLGPPDICKSCNAPLMRKSDVTKCVVCEQFRPKPSGESTSANKGKIVKSGKGKVVKKLGFYTPEAEATNFGEDRKIAANPLNQFRNAPVRLSSPELNAPRSPIIRGDKPKKTVHFPDEYRVLSNQAMHATRALSGHLHTFTQELDNVDPTNGEKVGTISRTVGKVAEAIAALVNLQHQLRESE